MLLVGGSCFCGERKEKKKALKKRKLDFNSATRECLRYPNTASPQKVGPGPGHHPGLPVQVNWNA